MTIEELAHTLPNDNPDKEAILLCLALMEAVELREKVKELEQVERASTGDPMLPDIF